MTKVAYTHVLIATSNEGKMREIGNALRDLRLRLRRLNEFSSLQLVPEVGSTYEENASLKALSYASQTSLCAIADDSGLEIDVLGGLPGLHSARYGNAGQSDLMRNRQLLSSLSSTEPPARTARLVSTIVLAKPILGKDKGARIIKVARGVCSGTIAFNPRGLHGFGFDSIFVPHGYQQTFGELPNGVKNRISHRAQALLQLRHFLITWLGELDHECIGS